MYNTRRIFTHRVEISNLQKIHTRDNKRYTTLNDNKNIHTNSILIRVHKNSYLRKNPRPPLINLVCTFNNVETTNLQHYETGPHRHATTPRHISCVAFMNYARDERDPQLRPRGFFRVRSEIRTRRKRESHETNDRSCRYLLWSTEKLTLENTTRQRTIKISRARPSSLSPWYDWPPFFFHLNFPLLFERIRISMMRRKKWTTNIFARPFSSFSPDPRVPAIGISRGLVGKISRDFQQTRRIISFQILPNVHRDIWIFKFL